MVFCLFLTLKTDDVTKGRKDVDPHGRFRGEWVKMSAFQYFKGSLRSTYLFVSL